MNQASCDTVAPSGGVPTDCRWSDGQCQSRFKISCATRTRDALTPGPNPSAYDWKSNPAVPRIPTANDFPPDCSTKDVYYVGHSSPHQCELFLGNIQQCVTGMDSIFHSDVPLQLRWLHDGCATYGDLPSCQAFFQRLQQSIPPGVNNVVEATANLATGGDGHFDTHMTVRMTRDNRTSTYPPCRFGTFCYARRFAGQTIECMDGNSRINAVCCDVGARQHYNGIGSQWIRGTVCPNIPQPEPTARSGVCTGDSQTSTSYWCSSAEAAARAAARNGTCMRSAQTNCGDWRFVPGTCSVIPNNGVFTCSATAACPWTCSPPRPTSV